MCMLIVLKLYCVLELRNNSTEFEELEVSVMDLTVANAVSRIFATVNSTIDSDNSSNTVLLFLFLWNSPNVYTLFWKHTNKWRNICTFKIFKIWDIFRIRGSAGRIRHLENVKFYMWYVQQCTKIIKMPILKTYFS
jgi:hypothetical protein